MKKLYCVQLISRLNNYGGMNVYSKYPAYVGNGIDGKIWTTDNINDAHQEAYTKSGWFNAVVEECQ